jgi:multidrug transporter EmrE-like cation transporter
LIIGGLFEVGFACLGKANETKGIESTIGCWVLLCLSISMLLLYKATQELLGYRLCGLDWYWSCGTVLVGIVVFKEPATFGEFSFDDFNYFYCWLKFVSSH